MCVAHVCLCASVCVCECEECATQHFVDIADLSSCNKVQQNKFKTLLTYRLAATVICIALVIDNICQIDYRYQDIA